MISLINVNDRVLLHLLSNLKYRANTFRNYFKKLPAFTTMTFSSDLKFIMKNEHFVVMISILQILLQISNLSIATFIEFNAAFICCKLS